LIKKYQSKKVSWFQNRKVKRPVWGGQHKTLNVELETVFLLTAEIRIED